MSPKGSRSFKRWAQVFRKKGAGYKGKGAQGNGLTYGEFGREIGGLWPYPWETSEHEVAAPSMRRQDGRDARITAARLHFARFAKIRLLRGCRNYAIIHAKHR